MIDLKNINIVDSHVHFWDVGLLSYPWLHDNNLLNKPYLLENYNQATNNIQIEKMVFVQCECLSSQSLKELRWVEHLAQMDDRIKAIIPWSKIEDPRMFESDMKIFNQTDRVKGVRRIIQFEKDPQFCLDGPFVSGIKLLSQADMTFDICVNYKQLDIVIKFIEKCPDTKMVLDHFGKPNIKAREIKPWMEQVATIAQSDNIFIKLSGLLTEAIYHSWNADDFRMYVEWVIECFTADRIMFGGDWPVLLQSGTYLQWINVLEKLLERLNTEDISKIMSFNAERFYNI